MKLVGYMVELRAIELRDSEMLLNLMNDPEIEYMLGGWSFPISSQMQTEWIASLKSERNTLRGIIEVIENKEAIGTVILSNIDYKNGNAEIHIKISNDEHRGKGYGFDAINCVVKYAFNELRLKCVYAHVNTYNQASKRLFNKCGFEKEGILRSRVFKRGIYSDVVVMSIINDRN